jgi:hypothetical protein
MKTLITTPKSCWKENTHHFAVKTYFFTWNFNHYWTFKKTSSTLTMLRESRCSLHHVKGVLWGSIFKIKGEPLLVRGNHGESHLLLRDKYERMGFFWIKSYSISLYKERSITYGAISSTYSKNTQGGCASQSL